MTMSQGNEKKFEPHSDEDLATILEAQLLALRGNSVGARTPPAAEVAAVEVAAQEVAAVHVAAVEVAAVVVVTRSSVLAEMPLMFGAVEMHALMNATTTPSGVASGDVPAQEAVVEVVAVQEVSVEEVAVQELAVEEAVLDEVAGDGVTDEVVPDEVPPVKKSLPDLPVFVRKSFDDLISGG